MAHILIVDDSPTDAQALKTVLEGAGYRTMVAEDPNTGMALAKQSKPDVILMDVVFQGMSGFQGTRKLARDPETASIPVVIISSKDQESDRMWGLRQGAVEYLVKPVRTPKLLATVKDLLAKQSSGSA